MTFHPPPRGQFSAVADNPASGIVRYVKRCITFTEKTRYLFEINKGIDPETSRTQPHLVNRDVPQDQRPIPFNRMIYVGDGLTDIPCFSLVKNMGGRPFGIFQPGNNRSARQKYQELLASERVMSLNAPRYREDDELGALLRSAVATICSEIVLEREQA